MHHKEIVIVLGAAGMAGRALTGVLQKRYKVVEHDIRPRRNKTNEMIEIKADPEKYKGATCHVCFPYDENFCSRIKEYHIIYEPELLVIHSSVKPGTTKSLVNDSVPCVHSPIILDDNFFYSMVYFRKMIGYDNPEIALKAEEHMRPLFSTALIKDSEATELTDLCFGLYQMCCRSVLFEINRIFEISNSNFAVMRELIHYNNVGFGTLNKLDLLLFNQHPSYNKEDYRIKLLDILPENLKSAFFKLSRKSYDIEIERKEAALLKLKEENERNPQNGKAEPEKKPV